MTARGSPAWLQHPLGMWLLLALAWFATMSWRPLLEPDEGRYAEIPREMTATGDWVTPRLNTLKYFEKPPLQYWATAVAYSVVGVSEGSSRWWSCTLAFLCLPLVYCFARGLFDSSAVGTAALLALAINPYFAIVGQINLLDSGLTFFLTASVLAYLQSRRSVGVRQRNWILLAAASLALATLSKGLVAPLLAGGTALLHLALTRDTRPLRAWHLPLTVPVYLAITVPWFVLVSLRNPEFPEFFFLREHFARYLTNISDRNQPVWYFLPILLLATLPWWSSLVSLGARLRPSTLRDPQFSAQWFLVIWCAFTLVFFSASHSKLAPYIQPMMPALAVLLAPYIADRASRIRVAGWIVCAVVVVVATALVVIAAQRSPTLPLPLVLFAAAAGSIALTGALSSRTEPLLTAAASVVAFQSLMVSYSHLSPVRTSKPLLAIVKPFIRPSTQLYSVDDYRQSIPPYLERTVRLALYQGEMEFGVSQEPHKFIGTLAQFEAEWIAQHDAVAFVDPERFPVLMQDGLPFREIARDDRTIVIARQ